jgi:hypothetical protein
MEIQLMAKGGDLTGKMGGTGFGPAPDGNTPIPFASTSKKEAKDGKEGKEPKHPDFKPPQDQKMKDPRSGKASGHGGIGGTPSSVRPKV